MKRYLFLFTLAYSIEINTLKAFDPLSFFKGSSQETPEQTVERLTNNQIAAPKDPFVNYNLGVAQYKINNYSQAASNFERAAKYSKTKKDLRQRAFFNGANSFYKDTLSSLPPSWESSEVTVENIDSLIKNLEQAIKYYSSVLKIDKNNTRALANKKLVEELLKKLKDKKKQQEKQQQNNEKNQNKNNNENDSSEDENKDQPRNDEQNNNENQNEKNKNSSSQKNEQNDDQKNRKGDKPEKNRKNTPDKRDKTSDKKRDKRDTGNNNVANQEESKKNEQQEPKHDSHQKEIQNNSQEIPSRNSSDEEPEKQVEPFGAQPAQKQYGNENEAMKAKALGAILDNLADDEAQLQKSLTTGRTKQAAPGQKLW